MLLAPHQPTCVVFNQLAITSSWLRYKDYTSKYKEDLKLQNYYLITISNELLLFGNYNFYELCYVLFIRMFRIFSTLESLTVKNEEF